MRITFAARTHLGMNRSNNEDNFFVLPEQNLYVVADGMGGHSSGEVASLIAVETLGNYFAQSAGRNRDPWPFELAPELNEDEKRLTTGIKLANQGVYEAAQEGGGRYHGMGTTIVAMHLGSEGACLGHVGDSRAYVARERGIEQVTVDHSLLNEYVRANQLRLEDVREHFAHKNIIVRALGLNGELEVEVTRINPRAGETYLLCSDGLTDMVEDSLIHELMVGSAGDVEAAAGKLVQAANDAGGQDNITVVLVRFDE